MRPWLLSAAAGDCWPRRATGCSAPRAVEPAPGTVLLLATLTWRWANSLSQGAEPDATGASMPTEDGYANQLDAVLDRSEPVCAWSGWAARGDYWHHYRRRDPP